MNNRLANWANIAQIISSVAIIVTIIILIVEVRANTETIQTQAISEVFAARSERNARLIENQGGLADIRIKVDEGDALTKVEEFRYRLFLRDQLDEWEYQFASACQFGRLPTIVLDPEAWADTWNTSPGISEEHERTRSSRNPVWLEYMEQNVISPDASFSEACR